MRRPITSGSRSSAPNVLWRILRLGSVIRITTLFALRHEMWVMERSEAQPHSIHGYSRIPAVCGPEPLVGCSAVELNGRPSKNLSNIEHFRATLFAERAPPTRPQRHGGMAGEGKRRRKFRPVAPRRARTARNLGELHPQPDIGAPMTLVTLRTKLPNTFPLYAPGR